ncbi:Ig-like domain-containing protein [Tenacibaculum ovolyticum]|uniref:Ig-like domain-containing protein n=1 Tax=Tenacibaculum ovolyticum TaxID=104270 RepID=UPI0007ED0BAA|nr:Ig-like domain-containing protein [Tenacibaculum ovolyticum]
MRNKVIIKIVYFSIVILIGCSSKRINKVNIITSDVVNFWNAYDKIQTINDSIEQMKYLKELFLDKGTIGLKAMMKAKNTTSHEYLKAINKYPKFWESVRKNTLRTNEFSVKLEEGIEKLRKIYPNLKPAKLYFTISGLMSNGTTLDSLVLIGSELAMADMNTVSSEFSARMNKNRRIFFDSNPIDNLVLLNVHEYVHTQQNRPVNNLLSKVIREGVAEFVSVKAMGVPSVTPAVAYGKLNEKVRQKFEEVMFYGNNTHEWLWSDAPNDFSVRDLGYHIGYELSERYYQQSKNKSDAIKKLIELDYTNEVEIENFVNGIGYFSESLESLYQKFQNKRPYVVTVKQFKNKSEDVRASLNKLTIEFSEQMHQKFMNFDYGPLGKEAVVKFKKMIGYSKDGKLLTFEIEPLQPNKRYQLTVGRGFRNLKGVSLKGYLIDFKTVNTQTAIGF